MEGKGQRLAVKFSADVGASLNVADLVLTGPDGQVVDASKMELQYNRNTHTARWTFPGFEKGMLPKGQYTVALRADVADAAGQHLDGNRDGTGGDDFTARKTYHSGRRA
jgi:hypothetical protein